MNINWFTVIAQIINFLLLVWLLKKFLYKPILNAIDEREKKITDTLKDADTQKAIAQKEETGFRKQQEDFDQQKKALMDKAVADADTQRQQLIDAAKIAANDLRTKMEKAAKEKMENDNKQLSGKIQQQVFAITRKALTDIASTDLEAQTANTFNKHLAALKEEEKKQFIDAFKANPTTILVRTAFDLSVKQQDEIKNTINILLSTDASLQFKTAPEMITGIELSTNGYQFSYSFTAYLNALEKNLSDKLQENRKPEAENK